MHHFGRAVRPERSAVGEAHVGERHGAVVPAAHGGGRDGAVEHPVAVQQGDGAQQRCEPAGELAWLGLGLGLGLRVRARVRVTVRVTVGVRDKVRVKGKGKG